MGEHETVKQIDAAFETWQSVCDLKFERVEPDEECEIKITFLHNHDVIICSYKLNGQKGGTLAHAFFPGQSSICGYIHDSEIWTTQKTVSRDGKYNVFSAATHELGHALGIHHSYEKDSVMAPFSKHGCSTENKHEILSESDKALIQQIYEKPKTIDMRADFK